MQELETIPKKKHRGDLVHDWATLTDRLLTPSFSWQCGREWLRDKVYKIHRSSKFTGRGALLRQQHRDRHTRAKVHTIKWPY